MVVRGCYATASEGSMSKDRKHPGAPCRPVLTETRSPAARAAVWTSQIMTVSLEMVLPGLAGYWIDGKLGTKVLFMLIGFALGGFAAIKHLIALTRKKDRRGSECSSSKEESPTGNNPL